MYQIESSSQILQTGRKLLARGPSRLRVSANVLFLGLTSLFTDISSEMVTSVLPLYMLMNLSLTPMAFGVVDGLYLGAAAVVRLVGGYLADRTRRYKSVAIAGYALSTVSRVGLLAFGSVWGWLLGIVLIDRIGKGIRSDPRDAMISFSTPASELATAFGVHRALDTAGAMIGPLIAFGILMLAPGAYDAVFVVSLCAALIGLGILVLFVDNRLAPATAQPQRAGITISAIARSAAELQRSRAGCGRWSPQSRDDERRVSLPDLAAPPRVSAGVLSAAVRRHGGDLHGARPAHGTARRSDRPHACLSSAATCCCCSPTRRCCFRPPGIA